MCSPVVKGAKITPDLMLFLLRQNEKEVFGAFGLDGDNTIMFRYSFVATTCERKEFEISTMAVLTNPGLVSDEIVAKWGGQRAIC
ncbi:MAG: hypothetical protein ACREBG_04020 [Pyrinomonadaceae bacterium]